MLSAGLNIQPHTGVLNVAKGLIYDPMPLDSFVGEFSKLTSSGLERLAVGNNSVKLFYCRVNRSPSKKANINLDIHDISSSFPDHVSHSEYYFLRHCGATSRLPVEFMCPARGAI